MIRADTRTVPLERYENMNENGAILRRRVPLEEAVKRIYEAVKPLAETECDLEEADGTILLENFQAQYDQPPFPRSPLDGYALRGEETKGASQENPVVFQVVDKLCAGDRSSVHVGAGQAVRIMTGAMIPEGANAVIRQEDTDLGEKQVSIWEEVKPYDNYCFQGEDYHAGDILVKEGTRLNYITIGILASGGKDRVKVRKIPQISLITTGNELIAPGEPMDRGKIYNTNQYLIRSRLREWGISCRAIQIADDAESVEKAILSELKQSDGVITTGGVSVGEKDILNEVLPRISERILFGGLELKPGSPTKCAIVNGKPVLALSGNPFAAAAVLELLGRTVVSALMGSRWLECKQQTAEMENDFLKKSPQRRFLRGFYENGTVHIPEGHSSGQIRSFAGCNCMIDIPKGSETLKKGEKVNVWML